MLYHVITCDNMLYNLYIYNLFTKWDGPPNSKVCVIWVCLGVVHFRTPLGEMMWLVWPMPDNTHSTRLSTSLSKTVFKGSNTYICHTKVCSRHKQAAVSYEVAEVAVAVKNGLNIKRDIYVNHNASEKLHDGPTLSSDVTTLTGSWARDHTYCTSH